MNTVQPEKRLAVLSALGEGNSIRRTEQMTGVQRDTSMRFLVEIGERRQEILNSSRQGFHSRRLQVDAIETFCQQKEPRLTEAEQGDPALGDP